MNRRRTSLWLMPAPRDQGILKRIINELAATNNAPKFEPHITLIGNVPSCTREEIDALRHLAMRISPFSIHTSVISYEQQIHRCLYITLTPHPTMTELRALACAALKTEDKPYLPHLSLLYADIPAAQKPALASALASQIPPSIRIETLRLQDTTGPVASWQPIASSPLQKGGTI